MQRQTKQAKQYLEQAKAQYPWQQSLDSDSDDSSSSDEDEIIEYKPKSKQKKPKTSNSAQMAMFQRMQEMEQHLASLSAKHKPRKTIKKRTTIITPPPMQTAMQTAPPAAVQKSLLSQMLGN